MLLPENRGAVTAVVIPPLSSNRIGLRGMSGVQDELGQTDGGGEEMGYKRWVINMQKERNTTQAGYNNSV